MQYIWLQHPSTLKQHYFHEYPLLNIFFHSFCLFFLFSTIHTHTHIYTLTLTSWWKCFTSLLKDIHFSGPTICRYMLGKGLWHIPIRLKFSHYKVLRGGWLAAVALSHNSSFLFSPDAIEMVHFLYTDFLHDLFGSASDSYEQTESRTIPDPYLCIWLR